MIDLAINNFFIEVGEIDTDSSEKTGWQPVIIRYVSIGTARAKRQLNKYSVSKKTCLARKDVFSAMLLMIQFSRIVGSIVFRSSDLVMPSFPVPRISYLLETGCEENKQILAAQNVGKCLAIWYGITSQKAVICSAF